MATVIDALVVSLALDATKFKAGSDQAQVSLKKTEEQAVPRTGHSYYGQGVGVSMDDAFRTLRTLVPSNSARMAWNDGRQSVDRSMTSETHIGTIVVNSKGADGRQLAADFVPALRRGIAGQANTGLA